MLPPPSRRQPGVCVCTYVCMCMCMPVHTFNVCTIQHIEIYSNCFDLTSLSEPEPELEPYQPEPEPEPYQPEPEPEPYQPEPEPEPYQPEYEPEPEPEPYEEPEPEPEPFEPPTEQQDYEQQQDYAVSLTCTVPVRLCIHYYLETHY